RGGRIPLCHRLKKGGALTVPMRSTVRTPRRHHLDVVEGSRRIHVQSVVAVSGRGLSSARMTRSWSPWQAGKAMSRERGGGPCRGRGTDVEGCKSENRESAQWNGTVGPAGVGVRRDGLS